MQTTLIKATDGYLLSGTLFELPGARAAVILNCATGAPARYYHRYARYLNTRGFAALTWDYRGSAASRPARMRNFEGSFPIWGERDFGGVLDWAHEHWAGKSIYVVGHSIGGVLPGFAPNNTRIDKLLTVGAQIAYWPDYLAARRLRMRVLWHGLAPVVTRLFGYFPGRALRLGEDLPAGIIREWNETRSKAAITQPDFAQGPLPHGYANFATLTAPTLAYSAADDEFATQAAVERLFALMRATKPEHRRIAPAQVQAAAIGHFGFFLSKFESTLWRESVDWLAGE